MKQTFNIAENLKHEWIMKEWGSFEDHKESPDHVVGILQRSPKGKVVVNDDQEAATLLASASYHTPGCWTAGDSNPDLNVVNMEKACERISEQIKLPVVS